MFVEPDTIRFLWPEVVLVVMASWIYLGGTFWRSREAWSFIAVLSYVVAAVALLAQLSTHDWQLWRDFRAGGIHGTGPLVVDFLGHGVRWLAVLVGLLFTLIASRTAGRALSTEVLGTLMLVVVGIMLVAAANELVFLFVGLEMISIPTYVLLFLGRRDRATAEATAKYFFLSILSSAILLYGFSFLYGLTGTTLLIGSSQTAGMQATLAQLSQDQRLELTALGIVALVLVFAGLGFKIAAVPFHFYAPDVYQGTTNANAGLLAVVPKIAGVVALVRLTAVMAPLAADFVWQLTIAVAVITMTIGNVCALWQSNLRRLMAYSSIAHAGYMLIGLAAGLAMGGSGGVAAMLFYLLVYAVASLGTFAALAYLGSERQEVSSLDELAGLGRTQPGVAGAIALFMFSLAGIPPLAGFWGKFALFTSAVKTALRPDQPDVSFWFLVLAVIGALNAAIAAAYYLRVIAVMFFRPSSTTVPAKGGAGAMAAATVCAVLVALVGIMPGRWIAFAEMAQRPMIHNLAQDESGASENLAENQPLRTNFVPAD